MTDDHHWQVTKAEDVTAARLSAGVHHRSCSFTLLEQHFLRRSPFTSPALCGPRSVTTWARYSDQPPYNWSSETKSEVSFYSILLTARVDIQNVFQGAFFLIFRMNNLSVFMMFAQSENPR